MKLAANLSLLYEHLPWPDRFAAAANDGFRFVEILFPYEHPPDWYARQLQAHGLTLVLVNTPVTTTFPLGLAAQPGAQHEFRRQFARVLAICEATGCPAVHVMAGPRVDSLVPSQQQAVLLDNLTWITDLPQAPRAQLEALNAIDVPGYFYHTPLEALGVLQAHLSRCSPPSPPAQWLAHAPHGGNPDRPCDSAGDTAAHLPAWSPVRSGVGLQFDFYHTVKQGLSLPQQLVSALPLVQHVQVAGSPQRQEPELARELIEGFRLLHEFGYRGFVGCEYRPRDPDTTRPDWATPLIANTWLSF